MLSVSNKLKRMRQAPMVTKDISACGKYWCSKELGRDNKEVLFPEFLVDLFQLGFKYGTSMAAEETVWFRTVSESKTVLRWF